MKLNTQKMHTDILKRLISINKPQRYLTDKLGLSRSTIWRIGEGKEITVNTFLVLVGWLEKDVNNYLVHEPKEHKANFTSELHIIDNSETTDKGFY